MDQVALLHGKYSLANIIETLKTESHKLSNDVSIEQVARLSVAMDMFIFNCDCGDDVYKCKNEILSRMVEKHL